MGQRHKPEVPISGRSRRPAIDPKQSSSKNLNAYGLEPISAKNAVKTVHIKHKHPAESAKRTTQSCLSIIWPALFTLLATPQTSKNCNAFVQLRPVPCSERDFPEQIDPQRDRRKHRD